MFFFLVKENYKIFSTEISAREKRRQNNSGSSVGRPFGICSPVGEFLSPNISWSSLWIAQFLVLPSTCEVSLRKRFPKPPVNAGFLELVIKRRRANQSWWPSLKAAPKKMLNSTYLFPNSKTWDCVSVCLQVSEVKEQRCDIMKSFAVVWMYVTLAG